LYAKVKEQRGRIDILFANAGVAEFAPLGEISEAHFYKTFGINVKGLLFSVQKSLPLFQDGGGGSIILNASIAASKGFVAFVLVMSGPEGSIINSNYVYAAIITAK
jgi:NAD(P)-dependent dehydrogenase (short-subunit alcohol dehydrogenase family)